MPEISPGIISGFERIAMGLGRGLGGIGRGIEKAAVPLAIGGGAALTIHEWTGYTVARGVADNPPLQVTPVPAKGQVAAFDPKTGTLVLLGQGPAAQPVTGPQRAVEDTVQKGLLYAALAAAGVAAIVIFGRK